MVRVIAGEFKSRRLKTLEGAATRPTSDRLKETLFNLLQRRMAGCSFLDCFAGSGSIGIEALSRGAGFVAFVESSAAAGRVIRQNLSALGMEDSSRHQVLVHAAASALKMLGRARKKFDIVFVDPPYVAEDEYPQVLTQLQSQQLLNPEAIVVAEHSRFLSLADRARPFTKLREIRQGDSVLSLFCPRA